MVFFRWISSMPAAIVITAGLFLAMAALIRAPIADYPEATPSPKFDIVMEKPKPQSIDPGVKPRNLPDPPPTTIVPATRSELPGQGSIGGQLPEIAPEPGDIVSIGTTPTIRIAPQYPENCRSRNAQGRVVAQFDVTPEGNVVNVRITETADGCFSRTVRNTVSRWKYPPAFENGRPVMRYGVTEVFNFELT